MSVLLSSCFKLCFSNPYIFSTQCRKPLMFQTMNSVWSNNLSLKYQVAKNRKFKTVSKTLFQCRNINEIYLFTNKGWDNENVVWCLQMGKLMFMSPTIVLPYIKWFWQRKLSHCRDQFGGIADPILYSRSLSILLCLCRRFFELKRDCTKIWDVNLIK